MCLKKKLKLGCGVVLGFIILVIIATINSVRQPGINADLVRQKISPGMNAAQVMEVLQKAKGRNFYYYYLKSGTQEEAFGPEEFLQVMSRPESSAGLEARIWLVFLSSLTPFRVSYSINFGPDGRVASLTKPEGWD